MTLQRRSVEEYFREHGHLRVPNGHNSGGLRLDAWLSRQRAAGRGGRLSAEHTNALTHLGIRWGT
ncbi:helicase associated domain-containing protein [Streptomyces mirabilis]|uniref:helicase associated domain-containing protein n=1 Tax=Streptomyces mirabilis TaxID=68239 RepID=UPI0036BB2963